MASLSLTHRLKELIERTLSGLDNGELECGGKEQREALTSEIASGYVSNQSLKLLQKALVSFGEEGTLHEYLLGSKVVLSELAVKDEKVRRMFPNSLTLPCSPNFPDSIALLPLSHVLIFCQCIPVPVHSVG